MYRFYSPVKELRQGSPSRALRGVNSRFFYPWCRDFSADVGRVLQRSRVARHIATYLSTSDCGGSLAAAGDAAGAVSFTPVSKKSVPRNRSIAHCGAVCP